MEAEHSLCESLSHHESDKESVREKPVLLNDDPEMFTSDIGEGPNEIADERFHQNIDNFEIESEGKLSFPQRLGTRDSTLKINKYCLEEKQLVYNGLAGDLISPMLQQHMLYKTKCYNSNEYLSQPIESSFNATPCGKKSDLKASPISKFQRKNMLSEDENSSLVYINTNNHVQKATQFEDQYGNSYDVRDEPGIERTVPESYMNTTNKTNYKDKTDSVQEVPETYSHSPECNKKLKNIHFIKEQKLIYLGSAGDLISSIHGSNANIPKNIKNDILESLSQCRASHNGDFIHEINSDSKVYTSQRIMSPKTANTLNDNVKISAKHAIPEINHTYDKHSARNDAIETKETAMQHDITVVIQTKSTDSQIQSESHNIISEVSKKEESPDSVSFATECCSMGNWKWKNIEKYINEQHDTYSGFAGELITSTSRMHVRTPQTRQFTLRSLSQPVEYAGNKLIKDTMSEEECNCKVSRDLPSSLQPSTYNTIIKNKEIILPNIINTEEIKDIVLLKSPHINNFTESTEVTLKAVDELTETAIPKDNHTHTAMQSCDELNTSRKYHLIGINSCKVLQEQLDQTVPNKVNTFDYATDEYPRTVHNTNSPHDANNDSECMMLSPDVFAEKDDDISLYADRPVNVLVHNTYLNSGIKETEQNILHIEDKSVQKKQNVNEFPNRSQMHTVKDTPIYKENNEINGFISSIEKKNDLISFEDESLIEELDCLYAFDIFPISLTQPAVPTYLLRTNKSELTDNSSKGLETATKTLERCPEQEKSENTNGKIDADSSSSSEKENTCEDSCKSTFSEIILCTTKSSSTSFCCQNSVALPNDTKNYEASKQRMFSSVSSNCNAKLEEHINIQITPQNDKMQLKDQLHKTNISKIPLKEANAKNGEFYYKNAHSNADESCDIQVHLSPKLENCQEAVLQNLKNCMSSPSNEKCQQAQSIENQLVSKGDVIFVAKPFKQLDSCITSTTLQSVSILENQTHVEKTDNVYLINKSTNDIQSNQIVPESSIENCINAAQKSHSDNHSVLTQSNPSNGIYLDVAENLCNEYSLGSIKLLKHQAKVKDDKEEDYQEMDKYVHSFSEEYDSDVSISVTSSESDIDLHIDDAIEKYQNASSGSEKICTQGPQNMVNSMEVSTQTEIFGLVQMEQCICKKFQFCCEFCKESSPEVSENKEKKRQALSSDVEMPLIKRTKCYSQKIEMMHCSNNIKTENKMQVIENLKCAEDIKNLSQVYFNKSIMPTQPTTHDTYSSENKKHHHDVQGEYHHAQLFSWYTAEKNEKLQRSQEVTERETQQNPRTRASLRIGLSKRAKTKPLHYSSN